MSVIIHPQQSHILEHNTKFDTWNEEKKALHAQDSNGNKYINPREIWYIKMGVNIGNEQNGKKAFRRPVLVIKRIGNMYFCLPLTRQGKQNSKYYMKLCETQFLDWSNYESFLIISQGRVFDKRRFMHIKGKVDHEEFIRIKNFLKTLYF